MNFKIEKTTIKYCFEDYSGMPSNDKERKFHYQYNWDFLGSSIEIKSYKELSSEDQMKLITQDFSFVKEIKLS